MSLPTPPEAPQKLAQKQETRSNVYLYDKNDISSIPLTYDVIDFGKPQGGASPLVGWATGAFFAVGGLWNFFNLNGEGTIFAGILLCAIAGLLIAAGFFMNGYSIIANANGFRSGTANSGEITEWPVDRGYFTVKVRLGTNKTARMAMNSATLTITRPDNLPLSVQQVTFTGSNTAELKQRCEVQADRIWNWAVAKGYIFQRVLKARLTASHKSKDTLKRNAPRNELPPISYVQEMGGSSYAGDYDSAACQHWLLGLAHKIAQLWQVLPKNRHVLNQDSRQLSGRTT